MRLALLILLPFSLYAVSEVPWFTGPLLTPTPNVIPGGHYNFQPYIYFNHFPKHYNVNFAFYTWIGLNKFMDLYLFPQFHHTIRDDIDSWEIGDPSVGIEFQLLARQIDDPWPSVKFSIIELFPVGAYQRRNPRKLGTDIGGKGSFGTTFAITTGIVREIRYPHFFDFRLYGAYEIFTKVEVHGENSYGGDPTTHGTVYPGGIFTILSGIEYSLTRHWVFAFDIDSTYIRPTRFRGHTIRRVGHKRSLYSLSIAPGMEFNFSRNVGIIGGVWFTIFTRGVPSFFTGIISIDWYI